MLYIKWLDNYAIKTVSILRLPCFATRIISAQDCSCILLEIPDCMGYNQDVKIKSLI